jgi:hypothetical protein
MKVCSPNCQGYFGSLLTAALQVKSLSKTKEAEDKEKTLPIAYLGSTMASHGDDFEPDSEFGQCLAST